MPETKRRQAIPVIDRISIDYLSLRPLDGPPPAPILGSVVVAGTIHTGNGTLIPIEGEMSDTERDALAELLERVGQRLLANARRSLGEAEG